MEFSNTSNLPKEDKIKTLLAYAKECYKRGYKPTKKSVRKKFHLEIYNYFKGVGEYHQKAGINVAFRFFSKYKARSIIVEYVKSEVKAGNFPEFREIEKKFKIHFKTYFSSLRQLYNLANVNYSLVEQARKLSRFYTKDVVVQQKNLIERFIQKNVNVGIYPSVPFIQRSLNLSFYNLYEDIYQAYNDAGVKYNRPSPILLGKRKEKILTKIVKNLLVKMNFKIKRISIESDIDFNRSADMTVEDNEGRSYFVEIKAFREDYHVSKREISQLSTYMNENRVSFGIFITTSKSSKCESRNIWLINGDFLLKLLEKYNLNKHIKDVEWIQKSRVNSKERKASIEDRKTEIFNYILRIGKIPTKTEIQRVFKLDIRSVFGRPRPYERLLNEARIRCLPYKSLDT